MKDLGTYQDRPIYYLEFNPDINWEENLPNGNWCAAVYVDSITEDYFDHIINVLIEHDIGYLCAIGSKGEILHDLLDYELVDPDKEGLDHHVMTVWDTNLTEGLWYAITMALSGDVEIDQVVILDAALDSKMSKVIIDMVGRIKGGYVPE